MQTKKYIFSVLYIKLISWHDYKTKIETLSHSISLNLCLKSL